MESAARGLTSGPAPDPWCRRSFINVTVGAVINFNKVVLILVVSSEGAMIVGSCGAESWSAIIFPTHRSCWNHCVWCFWSQALWREAEESLCVCSRDHWKVLFLDVEPFENCLEILLRYNLFRAVTPSRNRMDFIEAGRFIIGHWVMIYYRT